jgi:hypothetical protein
LAIKNGINLLFFSKGYCIWELLHTSLTLWICEVNETIFLLTRKKYFCKKSEVCYKPRNFTKGSEKSSCKVQNLLRGLNCKKTFEILH